MCQMGKAFGINLISTTYLKLSVHKCDKIKIEALERVVDNLKDIKSLSRLVLSVREYQKEEIKTLFIM